MTQARFTPLLLTWLALLASCSSSGGKERIPPRFTVEEVPAAIEASKADLEAERWEKALERLRSAKNTPNLGAEQRQNVQRVLETAAQEVIDHSDDPGHLQGLMDVDIPRPLAVAAGIRAARLLFEDGERMKAFRLIRRLDSKFPQHPQKMEAADLLFQIGADLAADDGHYALIFSHSANAPQVLEYLVLNHPSAPRGDEALWLLVTLYVNDKQVNLAIEKCQDLLLWFNDSPYAVRGQAQIPHLRLRGLTSPEYDRTEMQRARVELQVWIQDHAGGRDVDLEDQVRRDLTDSIRRLADNDLVVARFYARVKSYEGARYHALRALSLAQEGQDPGQVTEAEELLESLPEGEGSP